MNCQSNHEGSISYIVSGSIFTLSSITISEIVRKLFEDKCKFKAQNGAQKITELDTLLNSKVLSPNLLLEFFNEH